jgi:hypothetical protein
MKEATEGEMQPLLSIVGKAIEILETMDECVVALKAAKLLQRATEKANRKFSSSAAPMVVTPMETNDPLLHLNHYWGPLNLIDSEMDLDFAFQLEEMDGANSFFPQM